jgi:hypothetical protein
MNTQKKSSIEIANEICDLFDSYGFSSETPVDPDELINEISEIIDNGINPINELVSGLKGKTLEITNITVEPECGCSNLHYNPLDEKQIGE